MYYADSDRPLAHCSGLFNFGFRSQFWKVRPYSLLTVLQALFQASSLLPEASPMLWYKEKDGRVGISSKQSSTQRWLLAEKCFCLLSIRKTSVRQNVRCFCLTQQ